MRFQHPCTFSTRLKWLQFYQTCTFFYSRLHKSAAFLSTRAHTTWKTHTCNFCLQRHKPQSESHLSSCDHGTCCPERCGKSKQDIFVVKVARPKISSRTRRRSSHPPRLTQPQLPGNMLLCYSWLVKNMRCQIACLVLSDLVHQLSHVTDGSAGGGLRIQVQFVPPGWSLKPLVVMLFYDYQVSIILLYESSEST